MMVLHSKVSGLRHTLPWLTEVGAHRPTPLRAKRLDSVVSESIARCAITATCSVCLGLEFVWAKSGG